MADRALVRNAADKAQLDRAARVERRRAARTDSALAAVMATPAGRIVCWELLRRARLYETSFDPSGSVMCKNEGRRQMGLDLLADLVRVDGDLYELMEHEARTWQRREDGETDAAQTPATGEGDAD